MPWQPIRSSMHYNVLPPGMLRPPPLYRPTPSLAPPTPDFTAAGVRAAGQRSFGIPCQNPYNCPPAGCDYYKRGNWWDNLAWWKKSKQGAPCACGGDPSGHPTFPGHRPAVFGTPVHAADPFATEVEGGMSEVPSESASYLHQPVPHPHHGTSHNPEPYPHRPAGPTLRPVSDPLDVASPAPLGPPQEWTR